MKQAFTIKQVKPNIFLLSFKDYYDMAMHFLRYQEYYESASPKFRGKQFEIFDFMRWYSKTYGKDSFTYPKDWGGFNIPGNVIADVYPCIKDYNKYDAAMFNAYIECAHTLVHPASKIPPFYMIGAVGNGPTLKHEIAHGFFYTTPKYKEEMTKLVKALKPNFRKAITTHLKSLGYTPKVYIDEIQAYLSTGGVEEFLKLNGEDSPFKKVFRKYYNE